MIVCIAEDRASCEQSVKLLLLSLAEHGSDLPVQLFFPPASAAFVSWLECRPHVTLNRVPIPNSSGFDVKPQALLSLMDGGHEDIVWIDSDIIALHSVSSMFAELDHSTFVMTEEALSGRHLDYGGERARRWGFDVGRILPFAVNSGVIRATTAHRALLERWRDLLESDVYREAQRLDWRVRPWHLLTDQDVLTAVLTASEFSHLPVRMLKRGTDIIQYFGPRGYTVVERLSNVFGFGPKFVHSQGPKPWAHRWERIPLSDIKQYVREIYLDLSPYTLAAARYRSQLDGDTSWMRAHFALSNVLRMIGLWYPPLVGLPIAIVWDVYAVLKRIYTTVRRLV